MSLEGCRQRNVLGRGEGVGSIRRHLRLTLHPGHKVITCVGGSGDGQRSSRHCFVITTRYNTHICIVGNNSHLIGLIDVDIGFHIGELRSSTSIGYFLLFIRKFYYT